MSLLVLERITDAVFPRFCLTCGVEGRLLCDYCEHSWHSTPLLSACGFCKKHRAFGATCQGCLRHQAPCAVESLYYYADPVARSLLGAWKYDYDKTAKKMLQRLINKQRERILELVAEFQIEAIVPVPLHYKRLCERGFDQAEELSQILSEITGISVVKALRRCRNTGHQAERALEEREKAMAGTPFVTVGEVPGSVLLVDDVWTTGATALAATAPLRAGGARRVVVWTLLKG